MYVALHELDQSFDDMSGNLQDKNGQQIFTTDAIYRSAKKVKKVSEAMDAPKEKVKLLESAGNVSGEFVYLYPPGIPILAPGEMITPEIIEYIIYAKEKGCSMQGTEDPAVEHLNVLVDDRQVWK